jgi:hypothetical protein
MDTRPSMFDILVGDNGNALAALAYMTYKKHKREVMSRIERETHAPPTAADIEQFYRMASSSEMIEMYMQRAEALSALYMGMSLDIRHAQLEIGFNSTAVGGQLIEIHRKLDQRRSWKRWFADSLGNLSVNFITILLIAGVVTGYQALDRLNKQLGEMTGVVKPALPPR